MMFHQRHLGNEIGGSKKFRLGVAAGDDDMQAGPARGKRGDHGMKIEIVIAQSDVELVEKLGRNDLCPCGAGHSFPGVLPAQRPLRRR